MHRGHGRRIQWHWNLEQDWPIYAIIPIIAILISGFSWLLATRRDNGNKISGSELTVASIRKIIVENVKDLSSQITVLQGDLASFQNETRTQMTALQNNFAAHQNNFAALQNNFTAVQNDLRVFQNETRSNFEKLAKRFENDGLRKLLLDTSVRVGIYPGSELGNYYASGSIIKFKGKYYILTSRHVILAKYSGSSGNSGETCVRTINNVTRSDQSGLYVLQNTWYSETDDVGLIEIDMMGDGELQYINISETKADLGTELHGVSVREKSTVYLHCFVQSYDENPRLTYGSDCGGTHGFSGCPYVNFEGELIGIHKGPGAFQDMDGLIVSSDYLSETDEEFQAYEKVSERTMESCVNQSNITMECFSRLKEFIQISARNPRTAIVPGYFIHQALENEELKSTKNFRNCIN
jgi:hypothetical protein